MKLWLKGAKQIVQVVDKGQPFLTGEAMKRLALLEDEDGLSIIVDGDGNILDLGRDVEIENRYAKSSFDRVLDVRGKTIVPGMVDAHSHPVWAGDRVHEFALKLAGASYMEVHQAGGGINFTVEKTRAASEDQLLELLMSRLERMLRAGTTTVECKSGYGLEAATEIKMLKVLEKAKTATPIEIASTFLGAHSIPKGKTAEEATVDVIEVQLPEVHKLVCKGELNVENFDVFCEKGIFDVDQTRRMLKEARKLGYKINFHGEEIVRLNSVEMGCREFRCEAISHLEEISPDGIDAMAETGSVAVILPTTAYILRLRPPPVREMIDRGVIVALGTDFNPNAFCLTMPPVMHLAAVNLKMSLTEAFAASTINAAHSIGRSKTHGSIEVGKVADLLVLDAPRWEHLIYQFGGHDHVIQYVIKRGQIVVEK